ncbi:MAG: hypothetical protein U0797_15570 [Gemmataceae bacterium]
MTVSLKTRNANLSLERLEDRQMLDAKAAAVLPIAPIPTQHHIQAAQPMRINHAPSQQNNVTGTLTQAATTLQTKATMTVVNDVTHSAQLTGPLQATVATTTHANDAAHSSHPTAGAQASQARVHRSAVGVLGYNYAVLAYNYSGIYTATRFYAYMAYSYARIGIQTGDLSKYNVAMQYAYAAWVYATPNSYAATLARTAYVNLYWASKGF